MRLSLLTAIVAVSPVLGFVVVTPTAPRSFVQSHSALRASSQPVDLSESATSRRAFTQAGLIFLSLAPLQSGAEEAAIGDDLSMPSETPKVVSQEEAERLMQER